jgi:hypothetical protein
MTMGLLALAAIVLAVDAQPARAVILLFLLGFFRLLVGEKSDHEHHAYGSRSIRTAG